MSQRVKISSVSKHRIYSIIAVTAQGDYVLKQRFGKDDPKIAATIRRIEAAGSIDLAYWSPVQYKRKG